MTEKCLTSTDHSRALCAKMYDLQTDGTLCDIQLRIGTNSLYLHSIVLAGCSDTLANELTRDSSDDTSCLSHLGVLDGDALQRLIRFLYTGEMLLNGDMDVSAISLCCQHMGLWAGVQLCEAYLKDRDEAATGVVVNYLTHGQNQTMSTDKPGVESGRAKHVPKRYSENMAWGVTPGRIGTFGNQCEIDPSQKTPKKIKRVMESNSFSHAVVIENSSCKIPLEVPPRESDKYKHSCKIPLEVPPRESDKYKHSCKIPLEVPPRESDKYKHRKCSICKETFATPDALVTHRKLCHQRARGPNPRNYSCDQCPYMARTEKLLLIHLNNKHDVSLAAQDKFPVHTCHVNGCGYKSLYKQYVWRHHEAQHTGRKFMCEYCGNELRSKVALTLHVRIHLGVKPHVCQICGQAFRQSSILKCHQRSVHETRTHHLLCHECPYTTSNKTSLDLHRYRRHAVALPSNISIYHCDICKFETVSKNTLQCHIRRHLGQRPFECKVCHKTFVSSDDLRGHAVWHLPVSERKYKCPYGVSEDCQYVAATNSKLNSHIRIQHTHKDDRPFTCHVCPYKSGVKGNLTKHLRSVHHIEVTTHQVRVMPYHRDHPAAAVAVTDPTNTTTAETQGRDTIFRQSDDSQTHTAVSSVLSITE
ncbi:hypothetical protein LSAT2_017983 [Lamellibrachia satsuma]|nr:hypothetical protein LSAT2_017983 [Lamellibrachia satsuma]